MSFNHEDLHHKPHHRQQRESLHPQHSHRNSKPHKTTKETANPQPTTPIRLKLTDYFDEAMECMLREEAQAASNGTYLSKGSEITGTMRTILLDWLLDVHQKFKMFPQTLFIVAGIIDRYLSVRNVKKEELQLVGAAALFIAAKYE